MLKSDIPLARLGPLTETASLAPSGWNAAMPMPETKTSTSEHAVARGDGREPDPDRRESEPDRQQPEGAAAVRPEAEERLDERRRDEHGQHQERRERVAEFELDREEGKQRRNAARGEVGRAVAAGQHGHPLAVDRRRAWAQSRQRTAGHYAASVDRMRLALAAVATARAGLLPAVAAAHVTIAPPFVQDGLASTIVFETPNERPPHATTALSVTAPPGIAVDGADAPAGWHARVPARR